jgi:hypothetical protein
VSAKLEDVRANDAREAAIGREFDAAWLGGKTVKVARKAQLPAALRTPIRYPSLTALPCCYTPNASARSLAYRFV